MSDCLDVKIEPIEIKTEEIEIKEEPFDEPALVTLGVKEGMDTLNYLVMNFKLFEPKCRS